MSIKEHTTMNSKRLKTTTVSFLPISAHLYNLFKRLTKVNRFLFGEIIG